MAAPKDPINYSNGVGKINKDMEIIELDAKAMKTMGRILNFVNKKLTDDCLRIFKPNNADAVMKVDVAADAVKNILPGELQRHALAEGNRFMCLYNGGFIDYSPGATAFMSSKDKKEKAYQEQQIEGTAFAKGISGLAKTVFPEAAIDTKGKKMLCKVLGMMAKELSDKAKVRGTKENVITHHDVKAAVEDVLPTQMANHAIPEGTKMTTRGATLKLGKKLDAQMPGKKRTKSARPDSKKRKKTPKKSVPRGKKRPPSTSMAMSALPKKRKTADSAKKPPRGKIIPKAGRKSRTASKTSSRKRTPSKAKGKKRPPSTPMAMSALPKRKKMIVPEKKKSGKTFPKVASKLRPKQKSAANGKGQSPAPARTRDGIGPKALKDAVKFLSKQPLSQDALNNISDTLAIVSEKLLQEIKRGNPSNIGPNEIRNAVKELFRGELETTAMARLTQVTATSH